MKYFILSLLLFSTHIIINAQENIDIIDVIKKHGMEKSQVYETASWITDVYGPRLTGSPMLDKATEWAQVTLKDWGMSNVYLDEWGPFGRGWQLDYFTMHAESPLYWPIIAYPKAWSPSVEAKGEVIFLNIKDEADIETYRGKLAGKFVLMDTIRNVEPPFDAKGKRHTTEEDETGLEDLV